MVTVTEYRISDSGDVFAVHQMVREAFRTVETPPRRLPGLTRRGPSLEPARTMTDTLIFRVREPSATTWGWRVDFQFKTPGLVQQWRPWRRHKPWAWLETTFVPPIAQQPTRGREGRPRTGGGARSTGDEREVYQGHPDVQKPMAPRAEVPTTTTSAAQGTDHNTA